MADGMLGFYGSERSDELLRDIRPPYPPTPDPHPTFFSPVPNKPYVASVDEKHLEKGKENEKKTRAKSRQRESSLL